MPELKEVTVTYDRKQSTGKYSNATFGAIATVTPDRGESAAVATLKAMEFCRNHVMLQMSGPFPALKARLDGLCLDLDGIQAMRTFDSLPESVQQAMVEEGIDPDLFVYTLLPENIEAELDVKGD